MSVIHVDFVSRKRGQGTSVINKFITHEPKGNQKCKALCYGELNGLRPKGHPEIIKRGPRGKVLLEVGQVWVEIHNRDLWRINQLDMRRDGKYQVTLGLYYHPRSFHRSLTETTLRGNMDIWDVVPEKTAALMQLLEQSIQNGEGAPYGMTSLAGAQRFFGLDSKGERID